MKTFRQIYWLLVLVMVGFQIQTVEAQYAEDALRFSQFGSSVGARSQGMGNANVGVADDYSALFGNPAGLSQQKSYEFSVGLSRLGYGNDATFFGNKTTDNDNAINLNNLGFVYPIATSRGGLTFAFGFGRVANFTSAASFDGFNASSSIVRSFSPYVGTQYEDFDLLNISSEDATSLLNNHIPFQIYLADTSDDYLYPILTDNVQQTGKVLENGGLNNWSFGGAIDLAPNFSVGLSLNYVSGSYSYEREFTETDSRNVHNSYPDDINYWTYTSTFESDLTGFNALFGLMFRQDKYKIGMTLRTPTYYEISETFTDNGVSVFDNNSSYEKTIDGTTTYKIQTPMVLSMGASVQPTDWLLLAMDAEYTDWTEVEFDTDNTLLIKENFYIKKWMRDTWNLRFGGEVTNWNYGVKLRGGIEWKPSPWKDDPSSYDQIVYTAGAGVMIDENSTINASFALGSWNTIRDNYGLANNPISRALANNPPSRTSEAVTTSTFNLSFSYRF